MIRIFKLGIIIGFVWALVGCVSKQDVMQDIYLNDGIPAAVCDRNPEVKKYGMYRVVMCSSSPQSAQCQHGETKFEQFRPYCAPSAKNYLSILNADAEKWLSQLTKPQ